VQALQARLREHGQRVAVDPLRPSQATVGGMLATNDSGALRLRFGGLRDLVIGMTVALPDGTVARSGGKVVKNVAGYDLPKLMTGALGTLGVITTAIFRVHPLPQKAVTLSTAVGDLASAQRVLQAIQDSKLAHTSLQVRASASGQPAVDVLFEGSPGAIAAQTSELQAIASARFDEGPSAVWAAREDLSAGPASALVRVSVLLTHVASTIERTARIAQEAGLEWDAVISAAGIGWIGLTGEAAKSSGVVSRLRSDVEREGGSLFAERTGSDVDPWGNVGDALPLMKAVKAQFDPRGTLNPGRFVVPA
jgi:glycolate oxidase FAD binding subunit